MTLRTSVIVLTIAFSVMLSGCKTIDPLDDVEWPMPEEPLKREIQSIPLYKNVEFIPPTDGVFISKISSKNLLFNIEEQKAYIEKQEALIKKMKRYYNAK